MNIKNLTVLFVLAAIVFINTVQICSLGAERLFKDTGNYTEHFFE